MQRPALKVIIPPPHPYPFRKATIVSMLKYMYKNEDTAETTLQTIFNGLTDVKNIHSIKCHPLFIINDRPIIYVKTITINNCEIPIHMGFYRSTGISRGDKTIRNYWFPTTHLSQLAKDFYHIAKPEDNYLVKYDNKSLVLSSDETEIKEQDELLTYGRFINENNALVCYFLTTKNELLPTYKPFSIDSYATIIHYTDCLQEPELVIRHDDQPYISLISL